MRHMLANIISVLYSFVKFAFIKLFFFKAFHYWPIERVSPDVVINLDSKSRLTLGKRVSIHSRSRLCAVAGGRMTLGDNCSINCGCLLTCRDSITIGDNVAFGPYVMVFDHDHIFGHNQGIQKTGFKTRPISIGKNSWIGAGCIILAGTEIGENCVIAAGSVVKGKIPDNSVLIQKREDTIRNADQ